ncbi:MAG TPA: glycosyltransferase [Niallia sp.]|nr:glycosyltransferase [Niallia sp.]
MSSKSSFQILHVLNDLANGGVETFCLNVNRNIDLKKYRFDYFLTIGDSNYYKTDVEKLGAKVFNIKSQKTPLLVPKSFKIFYLVMKVLRREKLYDAIHLHQCKGINSILLAAYLSKVPVRVVHSHSSTMLSKPNIFLNFKMKIYSFVRKFFLNLFATHKLGCSKNACESMYGSKCFSDIRTKVIYNGINLKKFNKDKYALKDVSKTYMVNKEKINFINIGRFDKVKNQLFLIKVFHDLTKMREDVHLTIIGYGELEKDIINLIHSLNLKGKVNLLPQDSCIPEVLSTMNYFILPSLHEGLGIVLIEAQAMGLPCFVSDGVPIESQIGLCNYIPLEKASTGWASYINTYLNNQPCQFIDVEKLKKYDIKSVSRSLEDIYKMSELDKRKTYKIFKKTVGE